VADHLLKLLHLAIASHDVDVDVTALSDPAVSEISYHSLTHLSVLTPAFILNICTKWKWTYCARTAGRCFPLSSERLPNTMGRLRVQGVGEVFTPIWGRTALPLPVVARFSP